MRSSRTPREHQQAVSRRLALLGEELAAARMLPEPPPPAPVTHTRIRPLGPRPEQAPSPVEPEPAPVAPSPPAAAVPSPGRHAARGPERPIRTRTWSRWHDVGERIALGPAQLSVVLVLSVVALAACCVAVLRTRATPTDSGPELHSAPALLADQPSAGSTSAEVAAAMAGGETAPVTDPGSVVVDVAGRVRHPGIVVLETGARVVDAIRAAGGARKGVDLSSLNLARVLVDGEQIIVGGPPAPQVAGVNGPGSSTSAPAALVNLNTAQQPELESLPQVGPVTAQAIIGWREAHGGFTAVDQLLDVDGIGEATLNQIAPLVTV